MASLQPPPRKSTMANWMPSSHQLAQSEYELHPYKRRCLLRALLCSILLDRDEEAYSRFTKLLFLERRSTFEIWVSSDKEDLLTISQHEKCDLFFRQAEKRRTKEYRHRLGFKS